MTPTQRTLKKLKDEGWTTAIVEKWNPHAMIRQDLFGIIDILAIKDDTTLAVQVTSSSNVSARVKKITEHDNTPALRKAGWKILVHGWRKNSKKQWVIKEIDLS